MTQWLLILLLGATAQECCGDDFIIGPTPPPGPAGGPTWTGTIYPFLIKETCPYCTNKPTMRYQQVYNSSLFTNASPGSIYVTTLKFIAQYGGPPPLDWIVPSMQINLSTTSKSADNLSMVFSENVGSDDTMVLAPTSYFFPDSPDIVLLNRPFRYTPPLGNLLMDVRIFDGSGDPFPPSDPFPQMQAFNSPTDEVSRVWSTNVIAATASGSDTVGLETLIQLTPIPSLRAYASYFGTTTNFVAIEWPTQPTVFVLQRSPSLGASALWQPVSNAGVFSNSAFQRYYFPANSAGPAAFYRLVWPSGTAETRTVAVPNSAKGTTNQGTH